MTQYFFESKDDFELFYCPFDYDNTREIVELHVHHTDFRLLSRIHLVKIGLYEGCEKLNLFYPKNGWEYISDENEDLRRIESWETKILNFSSKIYFNELNEREIHYLGIDSEEIKNHCNDIWKRL